MAEKTLNLLRLVNQNYPEAPIFAPAFSVPVKDCPSLKVEVVRLTESDYKAVLKQAEQDQAKELSNPAFVAENKEFADMTGLDTTTIPSSVIPYLPGITEAMADSDIFLALETTRKLCPPNLAVMKDARGTNEDVTYVLNGLAGATSILYSQHIMDDFVKKHGEIYLLPSSIHEWLIVSKDYFGNQDDTLSTLKTMVMCINRDGLLKRDRLSDNVFGWEDGHLVQLTDNTDEDLFKADDPDVRLFPPEE